MKIVTGADISMREDLESCINSIEQFGYKYIAYDLGDLGFGEPFAHSGMCESVGGLWNSRGLHKPSMIARTMETNDGLLLYLDADTRIEKQLDIDTDFDIAVAVRRPKEMTGNDTQKTMRGKYNAGVVFINNNARTKAFVQEWCRITDAIGNDQLALNMLLLNAFGGVKIKELPAEFNDSTISEDTIIYHRKGGKRHPAIVYAQAI